MARKPASSSSPPPVGKGGAVRTPEVVLKQRLDHVYSYVRDGQRTEMVYRLVAKSYTEEVSQRRSAAAQIKEFTDAGDLDAARKVVAAPIIWANADGTMPHSRTIDRYIKAAKARLESEAAERVRKGDFIVGRQYARLDDLYGRAVSGGHLMTAVAIAQEVNKMHGLHGAIRLELSTPAGRPVQVEDVTHLTDTEKAARDELRKLLGAGAARAGVDLSGSALTGGVES